MFSWVCCSLLANLSFSLSLSLYIYVYFAQENSYAESNDSTSNFPDNGDDCEGILPPIRRSKWSSALCPKVHETIAPKKNTHAPNQKTQSSQAPSPHKMLWSQQVEEEEARLHSSNSMPNKMMTLYYDHSDPSNPVKATQYWFVPNWCINWFMSSWCSLIEGVINKIYNLLHHELG